MRSHPGLTLAGALDRNKQLGAFHLSAE